MRIQFPVSSSTSSTSSVISVIPTDSTARPALERATIRSTGPAAPWQAPQTGRSTGPLTARGAGRRLGNAPRRRAY